MIIVTNRPFDVSGIINEYPENSVGRQLLTQMSESAGEYRYSTLNQLKFELLLRKSIVNAAQELNSSAFSFAVFTDSKSNPAYWDRTENGGFKLKEGVKPSEGINDIFINSGKYATECATAMMIVYYRALSHIFPEEAFNKLFPDIYLMNWQIRDPLLKEVGVPRKVTDILLGDRGYFKNPDVDPQTPEWQGENIIVLPDDLYYGHGIGIKTADKIIAALNDNRKKDATESAFFLDVMSRPDFGRLADLYYRATQAAVSRPWQAAPVMV